MTTNVPTDLSAVVPPIITFSRHPCNSGITEQLISTYGINMDASDWESLFTGSDMGNTASKNTILRIRFTKFFHRDPHLTISENNLCAGGEFRTRDLQIMSIALVGEPLEFTNLTGTLTRLSYPGMI